MRRAVFCLKSKSVSSERVHLLTDKVDDVIDDSDSSVSCSVCAQLALFVPLSQLLLLARVLLLANACVELLNAAEVAGRRMKDFDLILIEGGFFWTKTTGATCIKLDKSIAHHQRKFF